MSSFSDVLERSNAPAYLLFLFDVKMDYDDFYKLASRFLVLKKHHVIIDLHKSHASGLWSYDIGLCGEGETDSRMMLSTRDKYTDTAENTLSDAVEEVIELFVGEVNTNSSYFISGLVREVEFHSLSLKWDTEGSIINRIRDDHVFARRLFNTYSYVGEMSDGKSETIVFLSTAEDSLSNLNNNIQVVVTRNNMTFDKWDVYVSLVSEVGDYTGIYRNSLFLGSSFFRDSPIKAMIAANDIIKRIQSKYTKFYWEDE